MANENKTLPIARVFSNLFHGFPKLLLTNLLFAIPAAVFFAIFYAVNTLTGLNSFFVILFTVIPLFPFYAGVVSITLHLAKGETDVDVCRTFFANVKENFPRFLVHGVLFYIAAFFTYYSITLYFRMGAENGVFYVLMAFCILIGILLMFFFYHIPAMTVSFELPMKAIYRNGLLMSFGELKSNLIATFGLFLLFVVASSFLICCGGNPIAIAIVTAVLGLFILPSVMAFIINSAIYKRMYAMITDREAQSRKVDKRLSEKYTELENLRHKKAEEDTAEQLRKLEIDESADGDEYIYFNGKMIKRSVLLKMKHAAEESGEK